MSGFINPEADLEENEVQDQGEDVDMEEPETVVESEITPSKKKRLRLRALESSEEDDDDGDDQALKDLIDDNPIEEVDSDEDKDKNSEDELPDILEEDDYELIEENLGVKVSRRRKFKRLRRMDDDDSDQEDARDEQRARDKIANQLFEGSDNEEEHRPESRVHTLGSEESDGEYSETDDFIVDDQGRPIAQTPRRQRVVYSDASLQKAQDIFGIEFDFDDVENHLYEDEDEEDDEYEEESRRGRLRLKNRRSVHELFEPHEIAKAGFTAEDEIIRKTDVPERMQMRSVPVTPADNQELEEEAEWIYMKAFFVPDKDTSDPKMNIPPSTIAEPVPPPAVQISAPLEETRSEIAAEVAALDQRWIHDDWDKQTRISIAPSSVVAPRPGNTGASESLIPAPAPPTLTPTTPPRSDQKEQDVVETGEEGGEGEANADPDKGWEDWDNESVISNTPSSVVGHTDNQGTLYIRPKEKDPDPPIPPPADDTDWENDDTWAAKAPESGLVTPLKTPESRDDHVFKMPFAPAPKPTPSAPTPPETPPALEEGEWDDDTSFKMPSLPVRSVPAAVAPSPMEAEDDWDTAAQIDDPPSTSTDKPSSLEDGDTSIPAPAASVGWAEDWDAASNIGRPAPAADDEAADSEIQVALSDKTTYVRKIKLILDLIRNKLYEVPFIGFYRKEFVGPELNLESLWLIYRLDAQFCQLKKRKERIIKLFEDMREFISKSEGEEEGQDEEILVGEADESGVRAGVQRKPRQITDEDIKRLRNITDPLELKDAHAFFSLHFGDKVRDLKASRGETPQNENVEQEDDGDGGKKAPRTVRLVGGGSYAICKKFGLDSFVKLFGLSPEKFAENVEDNYERNEVEQYPIDPYQAAKEMCHGCLKTPEDVLKAAKYMLAMQISREPLVRKTVRQVFQDNATVSCHPTKKGIKEIDEGHPCYAMKYLKDKPNRDFPHVSYYMLKNAEAEGLLEIHMGENIKGRDGFSGEYVTQLKQFFRKDEFTNYAQDWNKLREECLEFAFYKILYPVMRKELHQTMEDRAKNHVANLCVQKLFHWLSIGPYIPVLGEFEDQAEWVTKHGTRVLAIAYSPHYEFISYVCVIRPNGEPSVDFLRLKNLFSGRSRRATEEEKENKARDLLEVKDHIKAKKPHVIVIGGESLHARNLQENVKALCADLHDTEEYPNISVEILDNRLAKTYANSKRSAEDFPEYPLLLKEAISLGRRMQDPLIEFAQLFNFDNEILHLPFHLHQEKVPKEELMDRLTQQLIDRVNEVGVELNRTLSHPYTAPLVQFLCGLGPRKASALLKALQQKNQRLENRSHLLTAFGMTKIVFINCAGFVFINTDQLGDSVDSYIEIMDSTRIHPECYEWAKEMCKAALGRDAEAGRVVEQIIENPSRLTDFVVDQYAEHLLNLGLGVKNLTLLSIRKELMERYKDFRIPFQSPPDPEELFNMLTKETPETLYEGKMVSAIVTSFKYGPRAQDPDTESLESESILLDGHFVIVCPFCKKHQPRDSDHELERFEGTESLEDELRKHYESCQWAQEPLGVRVILENDIFGFIPTEMLSNWDNLDIGEEPRPEKRVYIGQRITCRITKISPDWFVCICSSRSTDLRDEAEEWKPRKDPFYDEERARRDEEERSTRDPRYSSTTKALKYVRRSIVHPCFRNVTFEQAMDILSNMDQGECIFRPSSKGPDHLTLTWKVCDGVFQNVDIVEAGKTPATKFNLAPQLYIGSEQFEDLNEIVARYVNPMSSNTRDLMQYKYFQFKLGGDTREAERYLAEEKLKNPKKIHYVFHPSRKPALAGKFMLSYLPKNKPRHEFVTPTQDGYRYRQKIHDSLDQLIKWFKNNYQKPPPMPVPVKAPQVVAEAPSGNNVGGMYDLIMKTGPAPYGVTPQVEPHRPYTPLPQLPYEGRVISGGSKSSSPYTPTAPTPHDHTLGTPITSRHGLSPAVHSARYMYSNPSPHATPATPYRDVDWRTAATEYQQRVSVAVPVSGWPMPAASVASSMHGICGTPRFQEEVEVDRTSMYVSKYSSRTGRSWDGCSSASRGRGQQSPNNSDEDWE